MVDIDFSTLKEGDEIYALQTNVGKGSKCSKCMEWITSSSAWRFTRRLAIGIFTQLNLIRLFLSKGGE